VTEAELCSRARYALFYLTPGVDLYVDAASPQGERVIVLKGKRYVLDDVKLNAMPMNRYAVLREFIFDYRYSKKKTP
jgi:hypothetical protein